jgi:hypothetical protein
MRQHVHARCSHAVVFLGVLLCAGEHWRGTGGGVMGACRRVLSVCTQQLTGRGLHAHGLVVCECVEAGAQCVRLRASRPGARVTRTENTPAAGAVARADPCQQRRCTAHYTVLCELSCQLAWHQLGMCWIVWPTAAANQSSAVQRQQKHGARWCRAWW